MRLPFTSVAVVPFAVGVYMAYAQGVEVSWPASVAGILAVFLITIGCYLLGEVFDQAEDKKTVDIGRTKFSGGTLVVANGTLPARSVKLAAAACFSIALILGIAIIVIHKAPWLLVLGAFGGFCALFYSTPPIRLVRTGFGELFIGICYGWLPPVCGYASANGHLSPDLLIYFWPIAFTVFNIILINEFPDYEPDRSTGKRNLLVRVGMVWGSRIYAAASLLTGFWLIWLWHFYRYPSPGHLLLIMPAVWMSIYLAWQGLFTRKWESPKTVEPICAMTIVLNLLTAVTVGFTVRW
jgi:1,4-dihydroxy-2-naphthoate octaprenyltransferase